MVNLRTIRDFFIEAETEFDRAMFVRSIEKDLRREFRNVLPKKWLIFPQEPKVYLMSNSLCIEFPYYGSERYMMIMKGFKDVLSERFVFDSIYHGAKVTYVLKKPI